MRVLCDLRYVMLLNVFYYFSFVFYALICQLLMVYLLDIRMNISISMAERIFLPSLLSLLKFYPIQQSVHVSDCLKNNEASFAKLRTVVAWSRFISRRRSSGYSSWQSNIGYQKSYSMDKERQISCKLLFVYYQTGFSSCVHFMKCYFIYTTLSTASINTQRKLSNLEQK